MSLLSGCALTHAGPGSTDDAPPPTSSADAGEPPTDAATIEPSTACGSASGYALSPIDRVAVHFDSGDRPLSLGTTGHTFFLAHLHGNPSPCDGPCFGMRVFDARALPGPVQPVYWSYHPELGSRDVAFEMASGFDRTLVVTRLGNWARWQAQPAPRFEFDGEYYADAGEVIGSVVPAANGNVHLAIHGPAAADGAVGGAAGDRGLSGGAVDTGDRQRHSQWV